MFGKLSVTGQFQNEFGQVDLDISSQKDKGTLIQGVFVTPWLPTTVYSTKQNLALHCLSVESEVLFCGIYAYILPIRRAVHEGTSKWGHGFVEHPIHL